MSLPELINWNDTRQALHQALTALLLVRINALDPLPNALRHSMIPTPDGVTTGKLKFGGTLSLNYARQTLQYSEDDKAGFMLQLKGHSQRSLAEAVLEELREFGHSIKADLSMAESTTAFSIDPQKALEYAQVQWRMSQMLARLKARFVGFQTPVALWAHGFDLSTLWFASGDDEHNDPHVNFGFSPGTPDIGEPYAYYYMWPAPDGLEENKPDLAILNTEWSTPGCYIPYSSFASAHDPEAVLVEALLQAYDFATTALKTS